MSKKLVYLACPYSHPDAEVRKHRFEIVNRCASYLIRLGVMIFSPISHTHPIAEYGLPKGWDFWEKYDRIFVEQAKALIVVAIDGWESSIGVQAEMEIAQELGIPVWRLDYPDDQEFVEEFARDADLLST